MHLSLSGYAIIGTSIPENTLEHLRASQFMEGEAGKRCLLDEPLVREMAIALKEELQKQGIFTAEAVAIQAIAFDKTPSANWKVAWHQDLMFPFAHAVTSEDYATPTRKEGIDYARPPVEVLNDLLAVRLHLDDCDESNGPLRVSPGTHRLGILPSCAVSQTVAVHGEEVCLAKKGEALLMKPLTLHASSQATSPKHRRVLHFVYHSGAAMSESWHRRV